MVLNSVKNRKIDDTKREKRKKPIFLDTDFVFCSRIAICGCDDFICHSFQKIGGIKY